MLNRIVFISKMLSRTRIDSKPDKNMNSAVDKCCHVASLCHDFSNFWLDRTRIYSQSLGGRCLTMSSHWSQVGQGHIKVLTRRMRDVLLFGAVLILFHVDA